MIDQDDECFAKEVSEKNFEVIEELFPRVSEGVKLQYITGGGFNPLHYASSPEKVRSLISSGVRVDVINPLTHETPLLTVIKLNKSPDVIRELIRYGATIEAGNIYTMNTPLNEATRNPQCPPETIKTLLEFGACVNTTNKYGSTPLHHACQSYRRDLRIIELLLKSGSNVNLKNLPELTPLEVALRNPLCNVQLVRLLLKFNAKVNFGTFLEAVRNLRVYSLDILSELIQHAFITDANTWVEILKHLVKNNTNEPKIIDCEQLIIKHSFLLCNDPQVQLSSYFRNYRNCPCQHIHKGSGSKSERRHKCTEVPAFENYKFFQNCTSEISCMKTDILESNISVYEFIVSKNDKVRLDNQILRILEENTYPIYSDVILNRIKRAALLDKLFLQQVYTVVQRDNIAQRIVLDAPSVCNIAKYLDVEEIRKFVDAFRNPSDKEHCFWDNLVCLSKKHEIVHKVCKRRLLSSTGYPSAKVQRSCHHI